MVNKELVLDFREKTDASLKESKEVIGEIATEEDRENARKYGVEEIKHLLELHRNPRLWDRLSTLLNFSGQWWPLRRAANVLGVSVDALRRHLEVDSDKEDPYRKWNASEPGHQDLVAASRFVIKEMDRPQIGGTEESW